MSKQLKNEFNHQAIDKKYFSDKQYQELKKIVKHPYVYYFCQYLKGNLR